ncbi:MAG: glycosyltransferase [Enterococcus lacertideformus]|uniref:Glycosyltransferase n=1 Tax=Enterococcus lacertideformus TaxID=2771493 RepID=A0A931FCE6_9ENTE|nr:glycosyltransferase [Enterococcus lacertideformus]
MTPKILVVVVLYEQPFSQSPSFEMLVNAVDEGKIQLVLYDNSPIMQEDPFLRDLNENENVLYYHNSENPGLTTAYNYALACAQRSIRYFIMLDQDSQLTQSYFDTILSINWTEELVAAVPMVYDKGKQLSPVYADHYINRQIEKIDRSQITSSRVMAINSGTILSIDFLKALGGFNLDFPLDFLDHWIFWSIFESKKSVFILSEKMEHDLSVLDYKKVSVSRYQSILKAENHFYKNYDRKMLPKHRKQLLLRTVKQFLMVKNRKIWRLTLRSFAEI